MSQFKTKEQVLSYIKKYYTVQEMQKCLKYLNTKKERPNIHGLIDSNISPTIEYKNQMTKEIESICSQDVGIFNEFCKNSSLLHQLITLLHKNNVRQVPLRNVTQTPTPRSVTLFQREECLSMNEMKKMMKIIQKNLIKFTSIKNKESLDRTKEGILKGCIDSKRNGKCKLPVAIKIFKRNERQRIHEIEILKQLRSEPVIVNFYKTFEETDNIILVSEMVDGQTLFDFLKGYHGKNEKILISIIKQVLKSLEILQDKYQFTHYDFHQNNILIQNVCKNTQLYDIPTEGKLVRFWDFDFSYMTGYGKNWETHVEKIHNDVDSRNEGNSLRENYKSYGMTSERYNKYYDLFMFMTYMKEFVDKSNLSGNVLKRFFNSDETIFNDDEFEVHHEPMYSSRLINSENIQDENYTPRNLRIYLESLED